MAKHDKATYAHTLEGRPEAEWQTLEAHLRGVAERARLFAGEFGAGPWGFLAGLWHDLGKYSDAFQAYLRSVSDEDPHQAETGYTTDHSTAGAQHAVEQDELLGHLLAYAISGHHAGLLDGRSDGACLEARLKKDVDPWRTDRNESGPTLRDTIPASVHDAFSRRDPFSVGFFVRVLFSCLVDADFLDTEAFMDPDRSRLRPARPADLIEKMDEAATGFIGSLGAVDTHVNRQRQRVYRACVEAAAEAPGLFSLTVPTGGGKTLSSLAFALRHAVKHGMRRVVYVIPFTSIVEQNADVFRAALAGVIAEHGPDTVLEHHCNLDVGEETAASRLATENWDAPLVVTTSVQFYESLFANRTSRCRKLHNLARAVIILDEAQTLPVELLEPCLAALRELCAGYGSTIVLCTATQPAVHHREDGFTIGLKGVREIVRNPPELYRQLKRVEVTDIGKQSDESLCERIGAEEQVLCIVNTRSHARELLDGLGDDKGHFHLSALMCPEHRSAVLRTIRTELEARRRCRVVSTQLIEAGVDIDFPCVYRSLAGLDSIAQAAGRCNREGRLASGRAYVFRAEGRTRSESFFAATAGAASQVLDLYADPLDQDAVERYFRLYYWSQSARWDQKQIMSEFVLNGRDKSFPFIFGFARVARSFKLIDDTGRPVIIPWGQKGLELCDELRRTRDTPGRILLRRLQRFTVQIRNDLWDRHVGPTVELVHGRYPVLISPEVNYSERTGLELDGNVGTLLCA